MSVPLISVVISVCSTNHRLDLVLKALENQHMAKTEFECIVIDDLFIDGDTRRVLKENRWTLSLSVLQNRGAIGRSMSRNRGWRMARAGLIAFLDEDMIPGPGWLETLLKASERGLSVCSGPSLHLQIPPEVSSQTAALWGLVGAGLPDNHLPQCYEYLAGRVKQGRCSAPWVQELERQLNAICNQDARTPLQAYCVNGANVMMSRKILEVTGGFAPLMSGAEDFDLGIRVCDRGHTPSIINSAVAWRTCSQDNYELNELSQHAFVYRHPLQSAELVSTWHTLKGKMNTIPETLAGDRPISNIHTSWIVTDDTGYPTQTTSSNTLKTGRFDYTFDEMVAYFAEAGGLDRMSVERLIGGAIADGLLAKQSDETRYLDIYHTGNWLRTKSLYHAHCLRNAAYARTHLTPRQCQTNAVNPVRMHCRGQYSMRLNCVPDSLQDAFEINMIIPVEHTHQHNVRLTRFVPSELEAHLDSKNGLFADVPSSLFNEGGGRILYEFECDISEGIMSKTSATSMPTETLAEQYAREYLRFTYPMKYRGKTVSLLNYILGRGLSDPETDARQIYCWIVENLSYLNTPMRDYAILDCGIGTCLQLSRLFANLVRLRGIPAREQCGALMTRCLSESTVVTSGKEYSPFGHTWAEFFVNDKGWCPAEFAVMSYSDREATPFNVDAELRSEMVAQTHQLVEYYFGNIDPYRVYASPVANRVPPIRVCSGGNSRIYRYLLTKLDHNLTCLISPC